MNGRRLKVPREHGSNRQQTKRRIAALLGDELQSMFETPERNRILRIYHKYFHGYAFGRAGEHHPCDYRGDFRRRIGSPAVGSPLGGNVENCVGLDSDDSGCGNSCRFDLYYIEIVFVKWRA